MLFNQLIVTPSEHLILLLLIKFLHQNLDKMLVLLCISEACPTFISGEHFHDSFIAEPKLTAIFRLLINSPFPPSLQQNKQDYTKLKTVHDSVSHRNIV